MFGPPGDELLVQLLQLEDVAEMVALSDRFVREAEQLDSGSETDLATLAQELGYADQAHLARDFRALVCRSPREYARDNGWRGQRQ